MISTSKVLKFNSKFLKLNLSYYKNIAKNPLLNIYFISVKFTIIIKLTYLVINFTLFFTEILMFSMFLAISQLLEKESDTSMKAKEEHRGTYTAI